MKHFFHSGSCYVIIVHKKDSTARIAVRINSNTAAYVPAMAMMYSIFYEYLSERTKRL